MSLSLETDSVFFCFPPLEGFILIVGDGDFGYSLALAEANRVGRGTASIIASSLDTKDVVQEKYSQAKNNLTRLNKYGNVRVMHDIDATNPACFRWKRSLDSVVLNFPYPPHTVVATNQEGRTLLTKFFQNMRSSLKFDGAIYITLLTKQANRDKWDLEGLAYFNELAVARVFTFNSNKIDGYEPKRAYNDENIPHCDGWSTFELCIRRKCTSKAIITLLEANGGELCLDRFRDTYEEHFGSPPFSQGGKLSKKIMQLYGCGTEFYLEGTPLMIQMP